MPTIKAVTMDVVLLCYLANLLMARPVAVITPGESR